MWLTKDFTFLFFYLIGNKCHMLRSTDANIALNVSVHYMVNEKNIFIVMNIVNKQRCLTLKHFWHQNVACYW